MTLSSTDSPNRNRLGEDIEDFLAERNEAALLEAVECGSASHLLLLPFRKVTRVCTFLQRLLASAATPAWESTEPLRRSPGLF